MWLKLAKRNNNCSTTPIFLFVREGWGSFIISLLLLFFLFSCSPDNKYDIDNFNSTSYSYHYRNLDSTETYARKALNEALRTGYCDGQAEAYNNIAFVEICRMNYSQAKSCLDSVMSLTDNQLERMIACVQMMRLCQRQSLNRDFYDYREQALSALARINENPEELTDRQKDRLLYAESELAIVTSTYYYYVGLGQKSVEALKDIRKDINRDTAQYLNYLYNIGAGGFITGDNQKDVNQQEFDNLMRCFILSQKTKCQYFAANSLEALAEHFSVGEYREQLLADNLPAIRYVNPEGVNDEELPLWLADNALTLFLSFGDTYQIAGAYRTLATCNMSDNDYESALFNLELALSDTLIYQAPDLVASIHEQLSVAYSAINDKSMSDQHRNAYLDLQERTRQDQWLEARAVQLEHSLNQLNILLWAVVIAIVLFLLVLFLFYFFKKKSFRNTNDEKLEEQFEELKEQTALASLHIEQGLRLHVEQQAKVSLVNGIMPFIDRMIHEEKNLDMQKASTQERIEYIQELTDNINLQNNILTHWIQIRKGELNIHIETFALQDLFDIVERSRRSFSLKGIELLVTPTTLSVKADKVLTLFMLNTLSDNARKFTGSGGTISLYATESSQYVEISVEDTGVGMDEEQLAHVFDHQVRIDDNSLHNGKGYGFGLVNCKGIIEKYRKLSNIFSVCKLAAESEKGKGSRFYFRLPKKLGMIIVGILSMSSSIYAQSPYISKAAIYADSAYYSNINGTYQRTLDFADSCRQCLNNYYRSLDAEKKDTLLQMGDISVVPSEIIWLHDSVQLNYQILLDMRNEAAVASLALHQWQRYHYNNHIYTLLFKELSADSTLDSHCRMMMQSQTDKQVAIIVLVLILIAFIFIVGWQLTILHNKRYSIQQKRQVQLEMLQDELRRLKMEEASLHVSNAVLDNTLSSLKHETMYYPSRIQQLLNAGDRESLLEVTVYYRELYGILSRQAMNQLNISKIHVKELPHEVLGNAVYIDYLFEILRKLSGQNKLEVSWIPQDDKYVNACVKMPDLKLSEDRLHQLFMPIELDSIPYLICREIVRQHAEATNRHSCGIRSRMDNYNNVEIIITLPRICKTSKSSS